MTKITKRYSASGDSFIEDNAGKLIGREWTDPSGNTYRSIFVNFSTLDAANGIAVINFVKEIKQVGSSSFSWFKSYKATINDKDYNYSDPNQPNFGVYEPNPYDVTTDADGNTISTLKAGLMDEAKFFSECFFFNSFGLVLNINSFLISTIDAKEGI